MNFAIGEQVFIMDHEMYDVPLEIFGVELRGGGEVFYKCWCKVDRRSYELREDMIVRRF